MAHRLLVFFLVFLACTATISVAVVGWDYYSAPQQERVFSDDHTVFRPSGTFGHTLGVLGASMIIIGVVSYSTRKRTRSLWGWGRLSTWLDVHIFLCLLGPILVVYHSTFKAGGIAAISLWTMLTVVASGIIGRFLYVLLPRNASGDPLDESQINSAFDALSTTLAAEPVGREIVRSIDAAFAGFARPTSFRQTVKAYFALGALSTRAIRQARSALKSNRLERGAVNAILRSVSARVSLIRRSLILTQVEQIFFYWHAIHFPFAIIMFLTLAVHVGVAIWLGYTWIL